MKNIFQTFNSIIQILLIIDIFLFPMFLIGHISKSLMNLEYLLWINIYIIFFGTILGSLSNQVIHKRVVFFFIITLLIFIISQVVVKLAVFNPAIHTSKIVLFLKSLNAISDHLYYALISLLISSRLSNIKSLINSNLKKVKSVKNTEE